jgi:capsular polysaccharide transport system permease protein
MATRQKVAVEPVTASEPATTPSKSSFYHDLTLQFDVTGALVMRELHTRFGRNNIGYLWLIGEPLLLATVIGALHFFRPDHGMSTMPAVPLSLLGYCVFIIFRGIFNRSESILESSLPLMYHRMVSLLNLSVARMIIEVAGCSCSLIILMGLAILTGYADPPARPAVLIGGIAWLTWLSFAMGLNCTVLTFDRPTLGRLVHPFSYFMMPLSGAFFAIGWMPLSIQPIYDWNPMACIFEYVRYGMFDGAPTDHLFPLYINGWCAFLTYTGLLGSRWVRNRIHLH